MSKRMERHAKLQHHPDYRSPEELRKVIGRTRKEALAILRERAGIKDVMAITMNTPYTKRNRDTMGYYCSQSQFRGTVRISISTEIWRIVSECRGDNCTFDEDLENAILDTILHEYGHCVAEFAKSHHKRLHKAITQRYPDEQDFAEEFMCHLSPNHWVLPQERKFLASVCRRYRRAAFDDQEPRKQESAA